MIQLHILSTYQKKIKNGQEEKTKCPTLLHTFNNSLMTD